ncbi:UDP-N-acetylglucosamine--dolichyl-phosphate N-acetylglucosaminephosphotransferase-like [Gordionus sp. m RMFG-2023]|uniref:UDP-N-acetylglucosamine--dolichyl-phosphate N-acetylglucosaminephosphotransferase-like n=1 Tax=Gordionus sp. m RMFG-2023 TaxID=3053472 RepID=UPI0031FD9F88
MTACKPLSILIRNLNIHNTIKIDLNFDPFFKNQETISFNLVTKLIISLRPLFLKANLFGKDVHKSGNPIIPEAMGIISGAVFIITMFIFIPIFFYKILLYETIFPYAPFIEFLAGLLSICCMLLLGFADDVLNLKWRYKLILPTLASLPLLMVYMININSTLIIIPRPLQQLFGARIDIGVFYYLYMGMLAVFCTNSINILSGINGLEVGQSLLIAFSILIFNIIEFYGSYWKNHLFSISFIIPYIFTTSAIFKFNIYPSSIFVGDTFCYYSGMLFAVIAILGHFSKTVLLFFLPQIFNFIFSIPQLFHLIPCPRHRMPCFDNEADNLLLSYSEFKKIQLTYIGSIILKICHSLGFVEKTEYTKDNEIYIKCSNMTLNILVLKLLGPMHEKKLLIILMIIQSGCSLMAFIIRYPLAKIFY